MKELRLLNIITGWVIFVFTSVVYLSTVEPTTSLWDCGEFIAASYKLQIGHPPGAPLFLLIGRIFSLFAGENVELVAKMVNSMSAIASSFTILFLFWTISHLAAKLIGKKDNYSLGEKTAILGSAVIGSLSYAFTDTFWFSAVEGEVYATSSLFTAVIFWAILKWENIADQKYSNRWLILIAYLTGLSIGVHLLNLLAIPAIILVIYFKKYRVSVKGVSITVLITTGILVCIMYILIPGLIKAATWFELLFTNGMGFPFRTGVFVYLIFLGAIIISGLIITYRQKKFLLNTALLIIMVICLGYSSYATIVIRSNANPPMDQNNPENVFNLLSYINREQYGNRPLFHGQYFNAPASASKKSKPVYAPEKGKYKVVSRKHKSSYPKEYSTFFPRMWSNSPQHIDAYLHWTRLDKSEYFEAFLNEDGTELVNQHGHVVYNLNKPKSKPDFKSNINFFLKYQLNHMYFRYFMWNFSGRQNDYQSNYNHEVLKGNWITGINIIDSQRLGSQNNLPRNYKENKARNKYFMIPLLLGIIGLLFQLAKARKDFWVITILFVFTGIAIVLYLNQNPLQPRERDYAYAASFYAFSVWIGLSVVALFKIAKSKTAIRNRKYHGAAILGLSLIIILDILLNKGLVFAPAAIYAVILMYIIVFAAHFLGKNLKSESLLGLLAFIIALPSPVLLAIENHDDHNRTGRYFARDIAINYLESCEENAILFTNGDNDTFPLWYVQEVEGVRTDVRVVNLNYLGAGWYINQMARQNYKSSPLPFSLTEDKYKNDNRNIVYLVEIVNSSISLKDAIEFVAHDEEEYKSIPWTDQKVDFIPQNKFYIKASKDHVLKNGTLKNNVSTRFVPEVIFEINNGYVFKNHLMVLDLLAHNNWERPVYYAITVSDDNYLGLSDYFEMAGLTYRIVPAKMRDDFYYFGGINTELTYDLLMDRFNYGNTGDPDLYYDYNSRSMLLNLRNNFIISASKMVSEGKTLEAVNMLDKIQKLLPDSLFPFDILTLSMADTYYKSGNKEKAIDAIEKLHLNTITELDYYTGLTGRFNRLMKNEKRTALHILEQSSLLLNNMGEKDLALSYATELQNYSHTLFNEER